MLYTPRSGKSERRMECSKYLEKGNDKHQLKDKHGGDKGEGGQMKITNTGIVSQNVDVVLK